MHGLRSTAVRGHLLAMQVIGLDATDLQLGAGIDSAVLADPDAYVPVSAMLELWDLALEAYGGNELGLRLGSVVPERCFGVIDYLLQSSATVRDALEVLVRYVPIVTTVERYRLEVDAAEARLIWDMQADRPIPDCARDYILTLVTGRLRALGSGGQASVVRISGAPFARKEDYPEYLGCPVTFFSDATMLCLPRQGIDAPVPGRDDDLRPILERHADTLLDEAPTAEWVDRVHRETRRALARGESDVKSVARSLGVSARTLQRRLAERGMAFTALLDQVRRTMALTHLDDPNLSIEEIGVLLGYSERRAFSRAFRRWTGCAPAEYRQQRLVTASGSSGEAD